MDFIYEHPDGVAATVIVTMVGAFAYCIKKTADSGVAFRSKCCAPSGAAMEVAVDTNPGSPRAGRVPNHDTLDSGEV